MAVGLLLIVLVVVQLLISVWLLARYREDLRRLRDLEDLVERLGDEQRLLAQDVCGKTNHEEIEYKPSQAELEALQNLNTVAAAATPEQLEQAKQILSTLGLDKI